MFKKMRTLIGNKQFYKRILVLAIPIMLQQGITNAVGLVDTLMVSTVGDDGLAGVFIASQMFFVMTALFIGTSAGAGIYIVQYLGAKDIKRMRESFLTRGLFLFIASAFATIILLLFGKEILTAFLFDSPESVEAGLKYLNIMILTIFPFAIITLYASTYRENKHTITPVIIGILAVIVNFVFNYLLIEGHYGFPKLGVEGAAIATLISRLFDAGLLVFIAHFKKYQFAYKVYRQLHISKIVIINVFKKTYPLLVNELFWSIGMIILTLSYSQYGQVVVNALTIAGTINNLFFIIFGGLATSISIIIGEELGANRLEGVKLTAFRLISFGVVICIIFGIILASTAPFTPKLFVDISVESQQLATQFMLVVSFFLWVYAYNASCFFILRAGGSTTATFIFDSLYTWLFPVPIVFIFAFILSNNRPAVIVLYLVIQCLDFIKLTMGTIMVKRGKWIRNLTT